MNFYFSQVYFTKVSIAAKQIYIKTLEETVQI